MAWNLTPLTVIMIFGVEMLDFLHLLVAVLVVSVMLFHCAVPKLLLWIDTNHVALTFFMRSYMYYCVPIFS